jgi:PTS system glucose-specific IIA component
MLKNLFKRKTEDKSCKLEWVSLMAPLGGTIVPIEKVEDPVFAEHMVGDGIAILPDTDEVLAPVSGILTHLFPTGHAAGITTPEGIEVLVHVGIDTVELKGDGFTILAKQGQQVEVGTPLIRLDLPKLRKIARSMVTPVIITNMPRVKEMQKTEMEHVEPGQSGVLRVLPVN